MTYLLTEAWFTVLALRAVDECGGLRVEAMQTIGLLVDKGIVLRDKLPADLGRIDGGCRVGHDVSWQVVQMSLFSTCSKAQSIAWRSP